MHMHTHRETEREREMNTKKSSMDDSELDSVCKSVSV